MLFLLFYNHSNFLLNFIFHRISKMANLSRDFLKSLRRGTKVIVKDNEDGDFEGILVQSINFRSKNAFVVTLEKCHRVGSQKYIQGRQDFDSDTIDDIEIVEVQNVDNVDELRDKGAIPKVKSEQTLYKDGQIYPVGGNVARRIHRYFPFFLFQTSLDLLIIAKLFLALKMESKLMTFFPLC